MKAGGGPEAQRLRRIGYWKVRLSDPYIFPHMVVGEMDPEVRSRVAHYLDAGTLYARYRGFSDCRFGCGDNGSTELTDGTWVWPDGLSHYVRRHSIQLPSDFLATALAPRPAYPNRVDLRQLDADDATWLQWIETYVTPAFTERLNQGRAFVTKGVKEELERRAALEESKIGLGDGTCISYQCEQRTLANMALCARCVTEPDSSNIQISYEAFAVAQMLVELNQQTAGLG